MLETPTSETEHPAVIATDWVIVPMARASDSTLGQWMQLHDPTFFYTTMHSAVQQAVVRWVDFFGPGSWKWDLQYPSTPLSHAANRLAVYRRERGLTSSDGGDSPVRAPITAN
jgi:hypothetical protein